MAYLKNHPGMWLRDDAAAAIDALEDKYGVIVINSAGRYVWEQQDLIDRFDRGEPGIFIPARPAETSSHVKNGGEAVDVYNYTSDRRKLEEFGFEWYGPRDPVHYTFRGWTTPRPAASPSPAASTPAPAPTPYEEEITMKPFNVILPAGRWATVFPQGNGKPKAVTLQGNAAARAIALWGEPVPFDEAFARDSLSTAVDGV